MENNVVLAKQASEYGWQKISFSYNQNDFSNALKFKDDLKKSVSDLDIDYILEIKSTNISEIRKTVNKFRNKASCISVTGGDLKVNRACVENVRVDVLSRPYLNRYDSGLNHILAKEAVTNNVAIELSFKDVLNTYLSRRSKVISNFKDIYTLYHKFDFPLVLSSGAESLFDIKTAHDFISFFKQTGLSEEEIFKSFENAENIFEFNKNRDNMIFSGVRRIGDET